MIIDLRPSPLCFFFFERQRRDSSDFEEGINDYYTFMILLCSSIIIAVIRFDARKKKGRHSPDASLDPVCTCGTTINRLGKPALRNSVSVKNGDTTTLTSPIEIWHWFSQTEQTTYFLTQKKVEEDAKYGHLLQQPRCPQSSFSYYIKWTHLWIGHNKRGVGEPLNDDFFFFSEGPALETFAFLATDESFLALPTAAARIARFIFVTISIEIVC